MWPKDGSGRCKVPPEALFEVLEVPLGMAKCNIGLVHPASQRLSTWPNDQTTVIKCRPGSAELGDLPEQFAFGCPVLRDYRYTPGFNKAQHSVAYAWHCNGATFLIEQDTVIAYLRGIEERRENYCRRAPQDARLVWDIDETAIQTNDVAMSCETL